MPRPDSSACDLTDAEKRALIKPAGRITLGFASRYDITGRVKKFPTNPKL